MRVALLRLAPQLLSSVPRLVVVAALSGLAAACASAVPRPEVANQEKLAALFAETYRRIDEVHIQEIRIRDLARGGLHNLAAADERLSFPFMNGDDILLRDRKVVHGFGAAAPRDYDAWGAVTSADVIATVGHSDVLQAMDPGRIYDLFMAGVAVQLGTEAIYFSQQDWETYVGARWYRSFDIGYEVVEQGVRIARVGQIGGLETKGVKPDDVITHVNEQPTAGLSKIEVFRLLSGFYGEEVTLTLLRYGTPEPISVKLFRQSMNPLGLEVRSAEDIVEYGFSDVDYDSSFALLNAVARPSGQAQEKGILLDLRNTPDHLDLPTFTDPAAAVRVADAFVGDGSLLNVRSRHPNLEKLWQANGRAYGEGRRLVILVDSTTIGGAELVAAALGDAGRALIIGGSTFGDGKLTTLSPMPSGGYLVTPSALAYAPAGYAIEERGVTPHVCTVVPKQNLDGLLAALRSGGAVIAEELRTRATEPSDKLSLSAAQRQLCPQLPDTDGLAQALGEAILREPGTYDKIMKRGGGL